MTVVKSLSLSDKLILATIWYVIQSNPNEFEFIRNRREKSMKNAKMNERKSRDHLNDVKH